MEIPSQAIQYSKHRRLNLKRKEIKLREEQWSPKLEQQICDNQYFNQNLLNNYETAKKELQYIYWDRGHPENENQSDGRIETIDSNIFKSSQSNVRFKTMKSILVRCDAYAATQNKFRSSSLCSCCLSTTQFSGKKRKEKKLSIYCLWSCTFRTSSFLSGLSVYWNNIFIVHSNQLFSAL